MKTFLSFSVLMISFFLSGCSHIASAGYGNGIPGFPAGHDLSTSKKAQA